MSIFNQLKQQVSDKLAQQPQTEGLNFVQASIKLGEENLPLLAWLKAQKKSYPHFYLKSRDSNQTIASHGAARQFSTLEQAQAFINHTGFTLIGGVQFEGECYFVLPRVMLVQRGTTLTASIYYEQAVDLVEIFANFAEIQPLVLGANRRLAMVSACDFNGWKTNIEKAIRAISAGTFSKVVLANANTLTFAEPIAGYDLLAKSEKANLGCYHFLWAENSETAFVGSTPERLYLRQAKQLYTEALAGTVAVTDNIEETERNAQWLLNDEKNIIENQLVVEDIASHLSDCVTQFNVEQAEIKQLHNVQHLRRQIQATLNDNVLDSDCLTRIHPTAAVAGLPRNVAKQFIAENESFQRGWYAGTLGMMNQAEAEFCVTLRSALIQSTAKQITVYAGAGIVAGSEPVSEWNEIERKSQALLKLVA